MAVTGTIAAVASLGYGVYAGEQARAQARNQFNQARQDSQNQQAQQAQMLKDQQAQAAALQTQQEQSQKEAYTQQQQVQQEALSAARDKIPVIQGQLGDQLLQAQNTAYSQQQPLIEARLNALGLLQSGALPEAQAKYQAQLEGQRQQELAQYGVNANQAVENQALNYAGNDAAFLQNNLNTTLQNQQQSLANQFQGQDIGYQNNVAQSQYLGNLQAAQTAAQQAQANQFINMSGQLGNGSLNAYLASKQRPPSTDQSSGIYTPGQGSSISNLFDRNAGYGATSSSFGYNPSLGALQYSRKYGLFN